MVQLDRRAGVCLFLFAAAAVSAPAAAKKPGLPGPVLPKEVLDPPSAPQPPPPESDGWPHTILSGDPVGCARNPGPLEVIVFRDKGFSGRCAVLLPGFYPRADNFLVGQDAISSVKVGSAVRLRVFEDTAYAGDWEIFGPGTRSAGIGELHDKVSSLRVEPADRSQNCDDLRNGEIALFENPYYGGDCVVLPGKGSYANADSMGIENDSISSLQNNSKRELRGFRHSQFESYMWMTKPYEKAPDLPADTAFRDKPNDSISSIQMVE